MNLVVVAGSGNPSLADSIAERLGTRVCRSVLNRFPDTELHAEIEESVRGCDVYVVQPTGPPVDRHLMELLFLADACRRAGASRLTGIVPYFGYARQDRRAKGREAVGGRLIADLLGVAGFERIVAVDLHTVSLEGFFSIPLEHLSAVSLLANAIEEFVTDKSVIVAPDLGAVKLAESYGELLSRPIAIAHKIRISGEEVRVRGIVGEVGGRAPIIVDDMISTGGTIEAAADSHDRRRLHSRDHGSCQPCIAGGPRDPPAFSFAAETNRGDRQSANSGARLAGAAGGKSGAHARRDSESPERWRVHDRTPEPPMIANKS